MMWNMTLRTRPVSESGRRWSPIVAELSLRSETQLEAIRAASSDPAKSRAMARRLGREGAPFGLVRRNLGDTPALHAEWFAGAREERLAAGLDPLDPVAVMLDHVGQAAARRAG